MEFTLPSGFGARSKFVFPLREKQLMSAVEIRFGNENICGTIQIAVVGRGGVNEFLRGGDAVLFEHHHQHLRIHHRAGIKRFHISR